MTFDVIFLFVSTVGGNRMYQVKQWIQPLQRLSKQTSLAFVTDNQLAADAAREAGLEVRQYSSAQSSVSVFADLEPKVILYPRKGYDSQLHTAYPNAFHVFIGHGESDKAYTADNHMRYFDHLFLAGEMGKQRLRENLFEYPTEGRSVLTGRPQLLDELPIPPSDFAKNPAKKTIIYTPTSDFLTPINQYASIASHGVALVETLLAAGNEYQVIYKPHPLLGSKLPANLAAHKKVLEMIEAAGSDHYYDTSPFGWQLGYADIMITDVSAVAYDWLATGKPLVVTRPPHPKAWIYETGLLGAFDLLEASDVPQIIERLNFESQDEATKASHESWRKRYYSDPADAKGNEKFITETLALVKGWEARFGSKPKFEIAVSKSAQVSSSTSTKPNLKARFSKIAKKSIHDLLTGKSFTENGLIYHYSAKPLKLSGLPAPAKGEKTVLMISSLSIVADTLKKTLREAKLRGKYRVVYVPSGGFVRKVLEGGRFREIYYTAHLRENDYALRYTPAKHILLLDHATGNDPIDHNLIAYHEIKVANPARAEQIEKTIYKPEGWIFS